MKAFISILACVLGLASVSAAAAYVYLMHTTVPEAPRLGGSIQQGSLRVGDLDRTYLAYVPARLPERPALVFTLHGSKGDGSRMRVFTGYEFDRLADRHGFIVVYPDGFENHWNDCRRNGPYTANTLNIDDPGFIRALTRRFRSAYDVDPGRIFAMGYSNGGHMAYRLALEMPGEIRAVAAVGANLPTPDNLDCSPSGIPVAVLILNGTHDPINPFEGGVVTLFGFGNRGRVHSAEESARYFSRLAGYNPGAKAVSWVYGTDEQAAVERTTWTSPARPEVTLYAVYGGGHTIPQGRFRFPRLLGRTSTLLNGPEEIWEFFARQMGTEESPARIVPEIPTEAPTPASTPGLYLDG